MAVIVFGCTLGVVLLLGYLALIAILTQIVALVLLGFAPVVLLAAVVPGWGTRGVAARWLNKLLFVLVSKAFAALVIGGRRHDRSRADRRHGLARVPVRVRAADPVLLGAVHLPQADHRPARGRDLRQRRAPAHPAG